MGSAQGEGVFGVGEPDRGDVAGPVSGSLGELAREVFAHICRGAGGVAGEELGAGGGGVGEEVFGTEVVVVVGGAVSEARRTARRAWSLNRSITDRSFGKPAWAGCCL